MRRKKEIKYITGKKKSGEDEQSLDDFLSEYIHVDGNDEQHFLINRGSVLNSDEEQALLDNIHQGIFLEQRQVQGRRTLISLVSASVIIIFLLIFYVTGSGDKKVHQEMTNAKENMIQVSTASEIKRVTLADGSTILLFPHSAISYRKKNEASQRNILLTGKAKFTVAKDPSRPFTVYSHQLKTTALGTVFSVEESKDSISIKLFEGKIRVEKTVQSSTEPSYYLTQGTEIEYSIHQDAFTPILAFAGKNIAGIHNSISKEQRRRIITAKNNVITIDNIPIETALERLAHQYHVEIEYSASDLKNINIIATVSKQQPIEKILADLAQMNNLHVRKISDRSFEIDR